MSLEVAIQQNTEALHALLAEMVAQRNNQNGIPRERESKGLVPVEVLGSADPAYTPAKAAKPKPPAYTPAKAAKPKPPVEAAPATAPVAAETAPWDEPVAVPYETVRQATIDLVRAKGRSEAEALLKSFGASNAKELDVSAYAGYVAQARAAMEREHAA